MRAFFYAVGAGGRGRTNTPLRETDFESVLRSDLSALN